MSDTPMIGTITIVPTGHEIRELRFKLRTLAKQNGRQGETIHRLRCELAEVREIMGRVDRGEVRDLDRQVIRQAELIAEQAEQIERLREKLQGNSSGEVTDTNGDDVEVDFT